MKEGQEDKRSEEHAFVMKKRSLWRSSGPCRSTGPLQTQKTSKERNFSLTFFLLKKNVRAARAIVDTKIVVAADTNEKKALAPRVVRNDLACRGQVKAQDDKMVGL